jgi:pimeloyl-ACP methyl ester carboxylesterase
MQGDQRQLPKNKLRSLRSRIAFTHWENPSKPGLLLLHGWSDHGRCWDGVADALSDRFNIVAPDLRGHGDSDWDPTGVYGGDHFLADTVNLLLNFNWKKTHVITHSGSGNVGLFLATLYPELVASLTMIEPVMIHRKDGRSDELKFLRSFIETRRELHHPVEFDDIDAALANRKRAAPFIPDKIRTHIVTHNLRQRRNGKFTWKSDPKVYLTKGAFGRLQLYSVDQKNQLFGGLKCPVLVIKGQKSHFEDPLEKESLKHLRQGYLAVIPNAHHHPHHEKPGLTLNALNQFYNVIERPTSTTAHV